MNKIFSEKLFSRLKSGISEINRNLTDTGLVFKIRAIKSEKSSPDPMDITFVISSDILRKDGEIKAAIENEIVKKQHNNAVRLFKRSFNSIKGKNKKVSITLKIVEYEEILSSFKKQQYCGYCGDIIFLEGHIYNPAYEALKLLSTF